MGQWRQALPRRKRPPPDHREPPGPARLRCDAPTDARLPETPAQRDPPPPAGGPRSKAEPAEHARPEAGEPRRVRTGGARQRPVTGRLVAKRPGNPGPQQGGAQPAATPRPAFETPAARCAEPARTDHRRPQDAGIRKASASSAFTARCCPPNSTPWSRRSRPSPPTTPSSTPACANSPRRPMWTSPSTRPSARRGWTGCGPTPRRCRRPSTRSRRRFSINGSTTTARKGVYDQARFLEYLKLPRGFGYVNPKWLEKRAQANDPQCDLNADLSAALLVHRPIPNDEPLVREYFLALFDQAAKANPADLGEKMMAPYTDYVLDSWLRPVLAEALIVGGHGNAERWASLLDPTAFQALKERVDIEFPATNPPFFQPGETAQFEVVVKNTPKLIVKIYEFNALNFFLTQKRQLNTDLNLDGLVANSEQTHTFDTGPFKRTRQTFKFPELKGQRGAWIIEFIGTGRSSRALLRVGQWQVIQQTGPAGDLLLVLDEKCEPVKDAVVWLDGRKFTRDAKLGPHRGALHQAAGPAPAGGQRSGGHLRHPHPVRTPRRGIPARRAVPHRTRAIVSPPRRHPRRAHRADARRVAPRPGARHRTETHHHLDHPRRHRHHPRGQGPQAQRRQRAHPHAQRARTAGPTHRHPHRQNRGPQRRRRKTRPQRLPHLDAQRHGQDRRHPRRPPVEVRGQLCV